MDILDVVELSPMQRGLYSVSMTTEGIDPYLVTFALRVENIDDISSVHHAFDQLIDRYPHLAGAVYAEDVPHPVLVMTTAGKMGWSERDLRQESDPEAAAWELYFAQARERIDLDNGPLFRAVAARISDRSYEVICTAHHIIIDGWSITVLLRDLVALHRGEGQQLAPAVALRHHAAWLAGKDVALSARVWADALSGLEPMPMIGPPPPSGLDLPVIGQDELNEEDTARVVAWARSKGLTVNTVLQMAWARVLSGFTGRDDVVFGQTTAGRDSSLPQADLVVGALVTTIPVRVVCDARDPAQVGATLQREVATLRAHEYLGIAEITRHAGVGQLFDSLLVFENIPTDAGALTLEIGEGASIQPRRFDGPSHYPVAVVPVMEHGVLVCRVEVRSDMTALIDADKLAQRFLVVVRNVIRAHSLSEVDTLLPDEPAVLRAKAPSSADGNLDADTEENSGVPGEEKSVPDVLLAVARTAGNSPAVIDSSGEQSFHDFAQAVRTLSTQLRDRGVKVSDAVAVMLPRDRRVLHAPFGVGLTGAVCIHMDPATPAERVAYILRSTGARYVLADSSHENILLQVREQGVICEHLVPRGDGSVQDVAASTENTRSSTAEDAAQDNLQQGHSRSTQTGSIENSGEIRADSPFYTVFTSGTTGRPKGVVVSHRALLSHWANHDRRFFTPTQSALGRSVRVGHGWSTGFDAAWQPTVALLSGQAVVLLSEEDRTDAQRIVAAIRDYSIDIFDTSPSLLSRLITAGLFGDDESEPQCSLAILALGGEAISPDTWRRLRSLPHTRVVNFYGPTETTVEVLMAEIHDHHSPTLGGPFDRVGAEVLDHRLRPTPPGGYGELYISGPQLAQGYVGQPGVTAASFVAGPHGRRYRTGDLVRRSIDDTITYLGRVDDQVKINGYRVEPEEVTVVLRELEGVHQAAVLAYTAQGRTRLGALVNTERSARDLRSALARRLPHFMVPSTIAHVTEIPLNRNDKVDRHAAEELFTRQVDAQNTTEPVTQTEQILLDALGQLTLTVPPNLSDSLADLGIDSITAIDLVSRLRGNGYRVTAKDLLAAADLRDVAQRLAEVADTEQDYPEHGAEPGTLLSLTALAHEIVEHGHYRHLAQTQLLELPAGITSEVIVERLEQLATAHPALRSRLVKEDSGDHVLLVEETSSAKLLLHTVSDSSRGPTLVAETVDRLDPDAGRMVSATFIDAEQPRLLLSLHHLAVDVVSWLILFDDLRQLENGKPLIVERTAEFISRQADTAAPEPIGTCVGQRWTDPQRDFSRHSETHERALDSVHTARLLAACSATGVTVEEVLLVACAAMVLPSADDEAKIAVTRESHGREADDDSRQVGWFTKELTTVVTRECAQEWRLGDGPLQWEPASEAVRGQIRLNYLGRFDVMSSSSGAWSPVSMTEFADTFGVEPHPDTPLRFAFDVNAAIVAHASGPRLVMRCEFNTAILEETTTYLDRWQKSLFRFAELPLEIVK